MLHGHGIRTHGRVFQAWVGIRHQTHHDENRTDVEQRNAPYHRTRGADDFFAWVFGFSCGHGHNLSANKGKHRTEQGHHHRLETIRHKALAGQMFDTADIAKRPNVHDGRSTNHDEGNNRHHFNQSKPEFKFTVVFHMHEVHRHQGQGDNQHIAPNRDNRQP